MPESDLVAKDWTRVATRLQARIAELKLSKAEVIRRSGVSQKSLDGYLAGEPIVRPDKGRGLCDALRWTHDSIDAIHLLFQSPDPFAQFHGSVLVLAACLHPERRFAPYEEGVTITRV